MPFFFVFNLVLVFVGLGVNLLNKWRFLLEEIEKFKKENLETRFEMLRMQVNPHFLFNSLNTLSSLIYQNQDLAPNFLRELSSVYRYSLDKRKSDLITVKEVVQFTESFIYLLGLRFEKKLIFDVDVPASDNEVKIVPMTLQVLSENAVKHNVVSMKRRLKICIFTENHGKLGVKNYLKLKQDKRYSICIGLSYIRTRLELLTDQAMEILEDGNDYLVKIPILKRHDKKPGKRKKI